MSVGAFGSACLETRIACKAILLLAAGLAVDVIYKEK